MTAIQELDPPTLPGRLGYYAETRPERVALRVKRMGIWQPYTWREYRDEVAACGLMLQKLGVEAADHIAILSDNRPEWVFADLGGQLLAARSVGIYQTNPPEDVAYVVSHSQSKVVFAEDQEQVDKLIEVADQTPTVTHIVVFEPRGTRDYDDPRLMTWDDFRTQGMALLAASPGFFAETTAALDPEAPTMVVYTSGTTGQPKGALISSRNALTQSVRILKVLPVQECDQVLSYLPLCHVAEKIFSIFLPLSIGAVVHFGESIETVRADLREVSPTVFLGVPRIWEKMHASVSLKMKDASWLKRVLYTWASKAGQAISERRFAGRAKLLDGLTWWLADLMVFRPLQEKLGMRRCPLPVTGAAPISPDLLSWFHGIGIPILEGFGQTECAGVSHVNPVTKPVLGTVGQVLPGLECVVADDGELLIRGPNVFCGYLHNDEATAATVDAEGWLHTGDIGTIDDEGESEDDARAWIAAGGKNLSPEKIENALKMSPYVKEAVAIGDRRKFISALIQIDGEAVGDWATRRELAFTSFADLTRRPEVSELVKTAINEANDRLARVEHVRAFRLFEKELHQDDGELTATQKVRRRAVTEIYETLIESIYTKGSP